MGKSCISRFFVLGLFLTSLLKPFEENLTVTILITLKRVLLHGHIAKMELMKWNIHIENVEVMWMMWTLCVCYVEVMWMMWTLCVCYVEVMWMMWIHNVEFPHVQNYTLDEF